MCAFTTETLFRTRHWHTSARSPTRSGTSKEISVAFCKSTISLCVFVSFTPSPRAKTRLTRGSFFVFDGSAREASSLRRSSESRVSLKEASSFDTASVSPPSSLSGSPSSSAFFRSTW